MTLDGSGVHTTGTKNEDDNREERPNERQGNGVGTYTETETTMDMDDTRSGRVRSGRVGARERWQWATRRRRLLGKEEEG